VSDPLASLIKDIKDDIVSIITDIINYGINNITLDTPFIVPITIFSFTLKNDYEGLSSVIILFLVLYTIL
jgi:hypothetical protein